jgi:integrase
VGEGEAVGQQSQKNGKFAKSKEFIQRPHSFHVRQRNILRNYVLFMANSGLRPNEARQLRWRDIKITDDGIE